MIEICLHTMKNQMIIVGIFFFIETGVHPMKYSDSASLKFANFENTVLYSATITFAIGLSWEIPPVPIGYRYLVD